MPPGAAAPGPRVSSGGSFDGGGAHGPALGMQGPAGRSAPESLSSQLLAPSSALSLPPAPPVVSSVAHLDPNLSALTLPL